MPRRYVPKLSRQELERRRLAAGRELLESKGDWGDQARIARRYGVNPGTVSRWAEGVREGGLEALRATTADGKPSRLTPRQREKLRAMLLEGATAHGYQTGLWTGRRVARLIRDTFGVGYSPDYIPELLRTQLGFSWQKPNRRPRELDSRKVERFLGTWREVKRGSSRAAGPLGSWTSRGPA